MAIIIYGIPNCDSIKKTIELFNKNNVEFTFRNYKKEGIEKSTLKQWCKSVGWEALLNKKGTTWKKIAHEFDGVVINEKVAIDIMFENNSIIKRPVVVYHNGIIVGYDEERLKEAWRG